MVFGALCPLMADGAIPVPRFTDPDRRSKLEAVLPQVEEIFETFRQKRAIPGLVFGVVLDGELVLVKGLGVRDRQSNDPVTADTVFRIASMTKSFTALAILRLRDEGKLSLEDPVSKWIFWNRWDDQEAGRLAADNLFLDSSAEERQQDIEKRKKELGACRPEGEIHPENLLRGTFRLSCEKGSVDVIFTLAPTMPPRVQSLSFTASDSSRTNQEGPCQVP